MTDTSRQLNETSEVSMQEIDDETAVALPNKEVLSLLDVNANVDLGLDLAAPVDLAVAANLNVAAPIEAAASANLLSPDAEAVSLAHQSGFIDQNLSGSATATAPQTADIVQDSTGDSAPGTDTAGTPMGEAATGSDATAATSATGADAAAPATVDAAPATTDVGTTVGDTVGTVGDVGSTVGDVGSTVGGVENLLNGGSLLNADINIDATANLTAPIDGAVAANANVAAPIDAAVAANIGSPGAVAEALAPQELAISQNMDGVSADATAEQDADISQS